MSDLITLTSEQLGRLLYKSWYEPSRNQKAYVRDCGGTGTAQERDLLLDRAQQDPDAVAEAKRLKRERRITAETVDAGVNAHLIEMLAAVKLRADANELSHEDLAIRCNVEPRVISCVLNGHDLPDGDLLASLALATGARWTLVESISQ